MSTIYFVINLAEKKGRWKRMLQLSSELGIRFTRVEAVTPNEIPVKKAYSEIFDCFLSPQQLACYYSHRDVWKRIASGDGDFGILLEDDIALSEEILSLVEDLERSNIDFDIIRLEATYKGNSFISDQTIYSLGGIEFGRIYSASTGGAALIISKKAAKKLLKIAEPVLPVDELLFNKYSPIWNELKNYQVKQILVWQLFDFGLDRVKGFESAISSPNKDKKNKKRKSFKTSIKKLLIKIKYLAKLRSIKTQKVFLDDSRRKKLEIKERERLSLFRFD